MVIICNKYDCDVVMYCCKKQIISHGMPAPGSTKPICEGQSQQTWLLFHQVFAQKILKVKQYDII